MINKERTSISSKNYHYFYSNVVLPFEDLEEVEEEIVIQQFDVNVGVQPPLEDGLETPRIPCIICMEREAVMVSLFCGHCCLCLNCARLFEERGN